MESVDRIRHAIQTNNSMLAYEVFLEEVMPLSYKVSPVLKISIEDAKDWIQDQLLDLACSHLLSIRSPEAWKSYIGTAVINRARSQNRRHSLVNQLFEANQDMDSKELEMHDNMFNRITQEDESLKIFHSLSLPDRAILKLAYSISPTDAEWKGLAISTQKNAVKLEEHFKEWFLDRDMNDTSLESNIAEAHLKTFRLRNRQRWLKQQLDDIFLLNPSDPEAEQTKLKELESCTAALNRQYQRYLKLQQPFRRRIPVAEISLATGLSENNIYQIISRSRKKIKDVLP